MGQKKAVSAGCRKGVNLKSEIIFNSFQRKKNINMLCMIPRFQDSTS